MLKSLSFLMASLVFATGLTACGGDNDLNPSVAATNRTCTPEFVADYNQLITTKKALEAAGATEFVVDGKALPSFQPTAEMVEAKSACDLFAKTYENFSCTALVANNESEIAAEIHHVDSKGFTADYTTRNITSGYAANHCLLANALNTPLTPTAPGTNPATP